MSNAPVLLQIGSNKHTGWKEVRIRRSLDTLADSFDLALTDRWEGQVRPIVPGEACQVFIGDERVLTGWVDDVNPQYDATNHSVSVNGRSLTADLIDCSGHDQRLDGLTLLQICRQLVKPFGIEVVDAAGVEKKFRNFAIEDGQPIGEALERAAQIRGVRLVSDADGRLIITHAVQREVATVLELGVNIRMGSGQFSDRDRFNEYTIVGQTPGDDGWNSQEAAGPTGTATDPRIRSTRKTLIISDTPADSNECKARAQLESRIRWAKGRSITYTIGGWENELGTWQPGDVALVRDPYLGTDAKRLVSSATLVENDKGRTAELTMVPPEAYEPIPVPEPLPQEAGGWS